MCSNPIDLAVGAISGDLGPGATCHEVMGTASGMNCGNFVDPRTFSVNGVGIDCVASGNESLPPIRNGGYCMEASAGQFTYAYFRTF